MRMMAVALVALAVSAAAQTPSTPQCASKLVACGQYINSTGTPPETCCGPLKEAVQNDLKCLCDLYASPEIFKAFNINITDALRLSGRCGLSDTTTACARPSGSGSGKNADHRTLSVGVPGLMSLFLTLWSVLA